MPLATSQSDKVQQERSQQLLAAVKQLKKVARTAQVPGNNQVEQAPFDGTLFVQHIGHLGTTIRHLSTKVCLASRHGQITGDAAQLVQQTEDALGSLHTMVQDIPSSAGNALRVRINATYAELPDALSAWSDALISQLSSAASAAATSEAAVRTRAGQVWHACDQLSQVPKSNTDAVLQRWPQVTATVQDAIEEFQQALEELYADAESAEHASANVDAVADAMGHMAISAEQGLPEESSPIDEDLHADNQPMCDWEAGLARRCLASAKLVKLLLAKVEQRGIKCASATAVWQDELLDAAERLPEAVDELGTVFWERPQDEKDANAQAAELLQAVHQAAERLTRLVHDQLPEVHQQWLTKCLQQLELQYSALVS